MFDLSLSTILDVSAHSLESDRMKAFKLPQLLCDNCPHFGNRWACPPFSRTSINIVSAKKFSNLFAIKISPTDKTQSADAIIKEVRQYFDPIFYEIEKSTPNSTLLLAGSCICPLSENCPKRENKQCVRPEKMRTSLEALGYDVIKIAKEVFNINILWQEKGLPEYLTLVYCLVGQIAIDIPQSILLKQ